MELERSREVAPGVFQLDAGYVQPRVAACYLVRGAEAAAVVETGANSTVPRILAALDEQGIPRGEVAWVIVTHVHLDHAGGAGALLAELPNAKLLVHPRGARHMIDPSKLEAGTIAVYGEARYRKLYGALVPIPAERVVEAPDGFTVDLGGRPLVALDSPGHAKHHFVLWDEKTRGFFTGDSFGLSYRQTDAAGRPFLFPTTSPVQFDPPALHATFDRMIAKGPERMYMTHFGMIEGDVARHAARLHELVDAHVRIAREAQPGPGRHAAIVEGLAGLLADGLTAHGSPSSRAAARAIYANDLDLNAAGLEAWMEGGK